MNNINITKLKEQGFCYGVTRAINIALDTVDNEDLPKPIYLLGNIVHNSHIEQLLFKKGIIVIEGTNRLQMLEHVPDGKTIIFSAHGVSDKVKELALKKHLVVIDATCPYVDKTFNEVKKASFNSNVIYIGKENHPETEAAMSLSNNIYLYNKNALPMINNDLPLVVANQTTMSGYDIKESLEHIKEVFPNAIYLDMLCKATERRQNELLKLSSITPISKTLIIVIGDKQSNNSNKLYELAQRVKSMDSTFIENICELDLQKVKNYKEVIIASGTSTPPKIIDEVVDVISNIDTYNVSFISSSITPDNLI